MVPKKSLPPKGTARPSPGLSIADERRLTTSSGGMLTIIWNCFTDFALVKPIAHSRGESKHPPPHQANVRTACGPGPPNGQPAWGGGCGRVCICAPAARVQRFVRARVDG